MDEIMHAQQIDSETSPFPTFGLGAQEALEYRKRFRGMIGVASKVPIKDRSVLSLVYTPGVAAPCLEIAKAPLSSFDYTIVFALANPTPEIMPEEARAAGARIVATGRSDYPNQVDNSLAFPGLFRGALDVRARVINDAMKLAAAECLASLVTEQEFEEGWIIPQSRCMRQTCSPADTMTACQQGYKLSPHQTV